MLERAKVAIIVALMAFSLVLLFLLLIKNPFAAPQVKLDLSRASVIKEINSLGNLETASFSIEKIIEGGQQGNLFQDLLYGDRILLIAHGKVVAGVNLFMVKEEDIKVNGTELTVNLPAPVILSSTLDNSKTTVYDRTQGLLSRGNKDLESEARRAAEGSITQAACEAGILEQARANAIERVTELFRFAGFTKIEVNIPPGSC